MKLKKHNRMILSVCLLTVVLTACGTASPKEQHDQGKQGSPSGATSVATPDGDEEDSVEKENTDNGSSSGGNTSGKSETANTISGYDTSGNSETTDTVQKKPESGGTGFRITEDTENKYGEFRK